MNLEQFKRAISDLEANCEKERILKENLKMAISSQNIIGVSRYYNMLNETKELSVQLTEMIEYQSMLN